MRQRAPSRMLLPMPCCYSETLPTHTSTGYPPTLAARSGSVSYRITAPSPWVLVYTRFCLSPEWSLFPPVLSVQFSSVAQSCPTLCDPMNRSKPGLPVHHHLPEFTQTHVLRVCDAIQPSHPLSSPSPPAPNPSQHQSLFQ